MMDKFKIFNKIKIDTDKYQEVETNNEELKTKMLSKINSSKRSMRKRNNCGTNSIIESTLKTKENTIAVFSLYLSSEREKT